ncbi:aminoglycoside 3'-phosphotransferase [Microbacterium phosphatis]|uniref:aminoglycoside 3'-phosphotransferase n=1 Tax=Microbacterium phosphatis TaxID=3140248 RepID=UPI003140063A
MSIPADDVEIPDRVRALVGTAGLVPMWRNDLGGLTFRAGALFVKWGPRHGEASMAEEAERIAWASRWTPVPEVRDHGADDDEEWLVTSALEAESAVSAHWLTRPEIAVRAIGAGLRSLHDTLPVAECPFDWSVPTRILRARERGIDLPAELRDPPPVDRLVVCHGDACAPNTLIDAEGRWAAHVDLGALGIADRWADIAVATMSLEWNFGADWEPTFYEAYGVEPDPVRVDYYRALWNAT